MADPFVPRIGGVMSADIAVPQHEREMRFYARVLGTGENPLWREDLMNNCGTPIIGLSASTPAYADLPLQWMPHIQVADVAQSAARALELGGSEVMHAKDDMHDDANQWAVLLDPDGAAFGLIPVVTPDQIPPREGDAPDRIGCISWLDLTVPDASASRDFYRKVVGWSVEDVEMKNAGETYADYNMLGDDGNAAAGVCHARGVNADLPPVWMLYLPVGDFAESLRRVREEGGEVIKETTEGYVYAVIKDPVGVCLALMPG